MSEKTQNNDKINEPGILKKYAQVLVCVSHLEMRTYSYLIPDSLKPIIKIGQPVLVNFGRQGTVLAVVVGFSDYLEEGIKAKEIIEIADEKEIFPLSYLKLLEWCSQYYLTNFSTVFQCAVPMKFLKNVKKSVSLLLYDYSPKQNSLEEKILLYLKEKNGYALLSSALKSVKATQNKVYSALRKLKDKNVIEIKEIDAEAAQKTKTEKYLIFKTKENAPKRQAEILEKLEKLKEAPLIEFEKEAKTTRATVKKLAELGFIEIEEREVYRNPLDIYKISEKESFPPLSSEQKQVYEALKLKLQEGRGEYLLHGVTASGKTEIYFNLIKDVLESGKNVLFLAPEIALASQLTIRTVKRFSQYQTALWHSSISEGERYDVWNKLKNNEIRILIGARSAVFAPLKNIGLIIMDEEHEGSFKQTTPAPRYSAKEVAKKLSEIYSAPLILGSATPDVSSYYLAKTSGNLYELKNRYNNVELAKVSIVDMREEFHKDKPSILSRTLIRELEQNLKDKKQSLILINRRGFTTYTQCMSCAEPIRCPNCDVTMVYHKSEGKLKCHWCDYETPMPSSCPKCHSSELRTLGVGTERIEDILAKFFPEARIARLDSDAMSTKTGYIEILKDFSEQKTDILIGTQMIAKGLDNENVTLVGVIDSDLGIMLPDFRASERGFQLLMQVAGRAGRGNFKGRAIFQTYNPEFYAISTACKQDYESFYKTEIHLRECFDYPPFSQIYKFVVSSQNEDRAQLCAEQITEYFKRIVEDKGLKEYIIVLGPAKCVISKLNREYRFNFVIKNKLSHRGQRLINSIYKTIKPASDIKIIADVNPLDMI
ncbi:primosomal protein N' [bacterium]|nr:primosomal protein N' [bacterium]